MLDSVLAFGSAQAGLPATFGGAHQKLAVRPLQGSVYVFLFIRWVKDGLHCQKPSSFHPRRLRAEVTDGLSAPLARQGLC